MTAKVLIKMMEVCEKAHELSMTTNYEVDVTYIGCVNRFRISCMKKVASEKREFITLKGRDSSPLDTVYLSNGEWVKERIQLRILNDYLYALDQISIKHNNDILDENYQKF